MNLREAAQQALEALENARLEYDYHGNPTDKCDADVIAAADALRTALAEPDADYERGFVEGMSHQAKSSVDRAVNGMVRKPLPNEEMRKCAQAMDAEPLAEGWRELIKFARAIEAAHGIKQEGA